MRHLAGDSRRSLESTPETKSINSEKLPSSLVIIIKWRKISPGIDNEIILLLFARRSFHFSADSARSFRLESGLAHPTLRQSARARGKRKTMPNAHNNSVFSPPARLVAAELRLFIASTGSRVVRRLAPGPQRSMSPNTLIHREYVDFSLRYLN